MTTPTLLIDAKNTLGECVLWCERTQRIWWTDILGATLWCHTPATHATQSWPMPESLASFAFTEDRGILLLGLASRLAFFEISTNLITSICNVESDLPGTRLNDGRCDRQGRFVFGTFNGAEDKAPIGSFYRLNTDLTLERLPLGHVAIANSICFSPDGSTMYYCDSLAKTIRCCDYAELNTANPNDRVFADLKGEPGDADGSAIDAEGYLWNAQWGGKRLVRYAPDGSVDRVVPVPATQPSCLAFGGADFDQLYISSARVSMSDDALQLEPQAGGLFHCTLSDVRGLPESRFAGHP